MTHKQRVYATLEFTKPDRLPIDLWVLPAAVRAHGDNGFVDPTYDPRMYEVGSYFDAWGCGWENLSYGRIGEVKKHPLADYRALGHWRPPYQYLGLGCGEINRTVATHDKFTVLFNDIRPFERMQFLRGTAELYMDIAEENPDFERTLAMVHEYCMAILETAVKTDVDAIAFMDDWGSQRALLINPEAWRKYFKPLYRDYCELAKKHGKKVYMHSDGNIECIIGDLVEIGVDALNSQLFVMDIEEIGRKYRGKITFWGELDRQAIAPKGSPDDVRAALSHLEEDLYARGGLYKQMEFGSDVPLANLEAMLWYGL